GGGRGGGGCHAPAGSWLELLGCTADRNADRLRRGPLGHDHRQHPVLDVGLDLVRLNLPGQLELPGPVAPRPLLAQPLALPLKWNGLDCDRQDPILKRHVDVVVRDAGYACVEYEGPVASRTVHRQRVSRCATLARLRLSAVAEELIEHPVDDAGGAHEVMSWTPPSVGRHQSFTS